MYVCMYVSLHFPFAPQYFPQKNTVFPAFSQRGRPKTLSFSIFSAKGCRKPKPAKKPAGGIEPGTPVLEDREEGLQPWGAEANLMGTFPATPGIAGWNRTLGPRHCQKQAHAFARTPQNLARDGYRSVWAQVSTVTLTSGIYMAVVRKVLVFRLEGDDLFVLVLPSAKTSRWRSRKFCVGWYN